MGQNWLLYIAAFSSAFGIALFATPFAKKISIKYNVIDQPKSRGMHKEPIPRMGGIAIVIGFVITMILLAPFLEQLRSRQFIGFIVGAIIIAIVGIIDDKKNIKPRVKLAFQILASLIVVLTGTRINIITFPWLSSYVDAFNAPITMLWIIGVTNAVNLIDGVDGLAAGVSSICATVLLIICIISGNELAVVLTATLAGSCLGFLPRNFSPAEIIMGDTGALFLGFVLSVTSIMGVFKSYALLSVIVALFSLALPIFDTAFAMIRRVIKGKPIMEADRGHLHHRLIDSGLSHKRAVVLLYGISALFGIFAILISIEDIRALVTSIIFIIIMCLIIYVYRKRTM